MTTAMQPPDQVAAIARVEAFVVPYRETNDAGSLRTACLVRVEDTDGVVGWGEAVTIAREAAEGTALLVQAWAPVIVGGAAKPQSVGQELADAAWWYGSAGFASFARSGIDMALWDLRGKALGRPLSDMLGPPAHESLPTLVSAHATLPNIDEQVEIAATWVDDAGAVGIKIALGKRSEAGLGIDLERDRRFLDLLRGALGADARICVDISPRLRWDYTTARDHCLAFEEADIDWIEEPLGSDDPEGYALLRSETTLRLAYGEREWSPEDVRRIILTGPVDVVGIDPGRVQGISGFVRCEEFVRAGGRRSNAHAFSGPLVFAASAALSLASPTCDQLEIPPTRNELFDIVGHPDWPVDGRIRASSRPGIGVSVAEDSVRQRAVVPPTR